MGPLHSRSMDLASKVQWHQPQVWDGCLRRIAQEKANHVEVTEPVEVTAPVEVKKHVQRIALEEKIEIVIGNLLVASLVKSSVAGSFVQENSALQSFVVGRSRSSADETVIVAVGVESGSGAALLTIGKVARVM